MSCHPTGFCQLEPVEGDGPSFLHLIHFNHLKDRCEPFIYSGAGGNGNRFENERECIRNCSANAENVYPMDGKIVQWIHTENRVSNVIVHFAWHVWCSFTFYLCKWYNSTFMLDTVFSQDCCKYYVDALQSVLERDPSHATLSEGLFPFKRG